MSGSEPVVSVITATFNHERFIRRCLESVISQTDSRWEQIVVDDGSDDGTEAIIRTISDPRIQYRRMPHRGIMQLAESYNLALQMSRGAFVAVLEGDDFWPADKIERQLRLFDRPETVLTWGRAVVTNEAGEALGTIPSAAVVSRWRRPGPGQAARLLLEANPIPACTVMCRREALARIGGFQQPGGIPTADYPTWLQLCRVGSFVSSNEVLGFHRRHRNQVTVQMKSVMDLVLDWGTQFVERLPSNERAALGLSLKRAQQIRRNRHGYLDYAAGRAALGVSNRELARGLFRQALKNGAGMTRIKASIGWSCALFGVDFESLVAGANRAFRGGDAIRERPMTDQPGLAVEDGTTDASPR